MSQHKYARALALAKKAAHKLRATDPRLIEIDLIATARRQPHLAHALMRIGAHITATRQEN